MPFVFYGGFRPEAIMSTSARPQVEPGRAYRTRDLRRLALDEACATIRAWVSSLR
jgi:hypothetical protein